MPTHTEAIEAVMQILVDPENGVISSVDEIDAVGHRVLHGGDEIRRLLRRHDEACKQAIRGLLSPWARCTTRQISWASEACEKAMPGTPQVAVFDTAFHMTMPPKAYRYAIPTEYYENDAIRRYGFHGTSHRFVARRAAALLGRKDFKMVNCHLGNGSSLAAIRRRRSVMDTSMGLSPLAGVPMGTRCGDIDACVVQFICNKYGMNVDECLTMLNKKSGVLAMSELSSDFRDLESGAAEGNEKCKLALEKFDYEVAKYVGAYAAAMNGLDVLTFTAGVGENGPDTRASVCSYLEFLGVKLDPEINSKIHGKEQKISTPDSKVEVWVIPTNEELMIAQDTAELCKK